MRIADSIVSRLRLLTILSFFLLAFASALIHAQDSEPLISFEPAVPKCTSAATSNWPISILMLTALSWALLEYAHFVLLLVTDEEAVTTCYQQRCSAAQMLTDRTVKGEKVHEVKKEEEPSDERELLKPPKAYERVPSDHISTNMIRTPSQLSDGSDEKHQHHGHEERGTPDFRPICSCEEEDYLVAMEDDVRKPGACAAHKPAEHVGRRVKQEKPSDETADGAKEDHGEDSAIKSAGADVPTDVEAASASLQEPSKTKTEGQKGASGASDDPPHEEEAVKAEQHFKEDLLPAAESTPIDAF
ncbi:hypothetical protein NDA16_002831 [Ustilago loliicola]|nr:hypothetical protein NDA16_002831 [Ustilago loliicola]